MFEYLFFKKLQFYRFLCDVLAQYTQITQNKKEKSLGKDEVSKPGSRQSFSKRN